ncbi:MAG: hypothetical protein GY711_00155 [bacterium]|nr:hypothetical protein [bacterium]
MLAACHLLLALQPAVQEPEVVESTTDDGIHIRYEVKPDAQGATIRHGSYTATAASGAKLADGAFKEGLRSGKWRYRFPNRELRMVGPFRDGRRSGKWQFRHPTGVMRAEGKFTRDQPSGPFQFLTADEEPDAHYSGKYKHENGEWPSGEPRFEGLTLDGEPHGPWTLAWPDGTRMLEAELDRGERVGTWRFYHVGGVFDPDFVSANHGASFDMEGFFRPLTLPDETVPTPPTELDPTQLPASLADVAPTPNAPGMTELRRGKIEVSIEAFLTHERKRDRKLELQRLIHFGPATLQVLVDELRKLSWRDEKGIARAKQLVDGILTPLLGGRSYGWQWATTDEAWVTNRVCFLRTYSYYYLTRDQRAVWSIDLALPMLPDEGAMLLLQPQIELQALTGATFAPEATAASAPRSVRARGGAGTEQALADGLAWLARHQGPNGSWDTDGFMQHESCGCDGAGQPFRDLGVTGLALLAFMGDGSTLESGPYASHLAAGVRWILGYQDPKTGRLRFSAPVVRNGKSVLTYSSSFIYEHSIATLALCRVMQHSQSPVLRSATQKAIHFIGRARNPYGAWRYDVPPLGKNDTSVTCWAAAALLAAERVGLTVDRAAYEGVSNWLDEVTDPANGRVGYDSMGSVSARVPKINDHYPPEKGEALTAMGLWTRFELGQDPKTVRMMSKHADLMSKTLPEWDPDGFGCDMYYWYHGTYAMMRMGGRHWKTWNAALKRAVLDSQRKDGDLKGSWDPIGPWGCAGGRVYSTAMMVMCLEVY